MTSQTRGIVEMTAAMTLIGTLGVFVIFTGESAINVVFWRCVFGAVGLGLVCLVQKAFNRRYSKRSLVLAVLGGIALVVNWVMLFSAFSHASIAVTTAIYNTQPFLLVCLGAYFFGEHLTLRKICWLLIAFVGVVLIVQSKPTISYADGNFALGIILALSAAFFWAVAAIITKKLQDVPPHLIALIQVTTGIVLLAPLATFSSLPFSPAAWTSLVTLGLVHTALMYTLMYSAVQKLPTHLQGALSFLYPVVAIFADYLVFGNKLDLTQISGAAVIVFAAAGMTLGWRFPSQTRFKRPPNAEA